MKKIEPVAAYIRVSTQEQKLHGISLAAQELKLQQYADEHDMKIVEWYRDEGVSGRKLIRNRPELQRMIRDAEQKKFTRIIFIKLDRFFRSVAEYHECMKRISPVVWTTTEEEYDLTTANGRLLVNMKLTIAELEADQTGERIRMVNEYKIQTGQPVVSDRLQPFGFITAPNPLNGKKKVIRDPEKEEIVRELLSHVLTHQSRREAVAWLADNYNISLTYRSVYDLLKNPMLCGEFHGNPNYCEAYLTREEFDRLQSVLSNQVKSNTVKRDYIFSGLIRCPHCGNKLAGGIGISSSHGYRYEYKRYRCANHRLHDRCDFNKSLNETTVEKLLLEYIEPYFENVKTGKVKISPKNKPKIDVEDIKAQIDRLNYSWQTGKIRTVEQYEKQFSDLSKKLEAAENQQKETEQDFSKIEAVLQQGWKAIYENLNDKYRQAFWRSFVQSIEIEWTNDTKQITDIKFF